MEKGELKGVSGGLWFFAFSLTVLTPIFILISISSDFTDIPLVIFNLIFIIFAIIVGSSIFMKKEKAIIWAKELLTAYLIIAIFELILYFIFTVDFSSDYLDNPFGNVIVSVIWLIYLNNSERVKNTFKVRDVNWKRMSIVILIAVFAYVALILIYIYSSPSPNSIQNSILTSTPQNVAVSGTLSSNYAEYREFADQTTTAKVDLKFSSDYPISVYFVPSEIDYDNFMKNEAYNSYQDCSFENKAFYEISCNVSTGGIIIYNPSYYTANYKIS